MNYQYPFTADGQQRRVQARRQEVRHVHRGRGAVQRARGGAHDAGNEQSRQSFDRNVARHLFLNKFRPIRSERFRRNRKEGGVEESTEYIG